MMLRANASYRASSAMDIRIECKFCDRVDGAKQPICNIICACLFIFPFTHTHKTDNNVNWNETTSLDSDTQSSVTHTGVVLSCVLWMMLCNNTQSSADFCFVCHLRIVCMERHQKRHVTDDLALVTAFLTRFHKRR